MDLDEDVDMAFSMDGAEVLDEVTIEDGIMMEIVEDEWMKSDISEKKEYEDWLDPHPHCDQRDLHHHIEPSLHVHLDGDSMDDDCHQQHRHHDQTVDCQEDDIRSLNHGDHLQDEDAVNRYVINPIRYIIFNPTHIYRNY